jgi:Spy/CpxP family protein refolding chaperone
MKSIGFRLMIAALAVVMASAVAKSQTADTTTAPPPAHPHFHHMGFWGPRMAEKLNLTDEQKTQMKAIWQKEKPTMKPLMQQMHQIDQQLHQYAEGTFDQAKVQALAQQKAGVQSQITVQETSVHNQMYQLLTPEQKTQLQQLEAQHQQQMQERMQQHQQEQPPAEQ